MIGFAVCETHDDSWALPEHSGDPRPALGAEGERRVLALLEDAGWRLVAQRSKVDGVELDLLLRKGRRLAIIEVKTRRSPLAEEQLTNAQRQRLERAAALLLAVGASALAPELRRRLPRRPAAVELWLACCQLPHHDTSAARIRFFRLPPSELA